MRELHADHFDSLEQQADAARLGVWVFLASELLLFAGLFALYGAYRALDPEAFRRGVASSEKVLGSANTAVLLVSSTLVASSVHVFRYGARRLAAGLALATALLGVVFLVVKALEYGRHLGEGTVPGVAPFWTLYYVMTGLHAVHVTVGVAILLILARRVLARSLTPLAPHPLELGAVYWHLVDLVWIFLWPLFYLG